MDLSQSLISIAINTSTSPGGCHVPHPARPHVSDLDEAVDFYSKLFATGPAKRRPGYANFAVDSPPLKLVLIENTGATGRLNHLGVEVMSSTEVAAAHARLAGDGLVTTTQDEVACWEHYVVLADSDGLDCDEASACCPDHH